MCAYNIIYHTKHFVDVWCVYTLSISIVIAYTLLSIICLYLHTHFPIYRPVPLQHFVFPAAAEGLFLVVDDKGRFKEDNFQKAMSSLQVSLYKLDYDILWYPISVYMYNTLRQYAYKLILYYYFTVHHNHFMHV